MKKHFRKLEACIIEAKRTDNHANMQMAADIVFRRKKAMDLQLVGFEKLSKKRADEMAENYSEINRLHRLVTAYAGS